MDKLKLLKILLTIGAFEFFGPVLRDTNASHLLNPEWVGHARFHIMWTIGLWFCMGVYSLILIWKKSEDLIKNLNIAFTIQLLNALGFWGSVVLSGFYGGDIFDAKIHVGFLNINENILVFILLSILLSFNFYLLKKIEAE